MKKNRVHCIVMLLLLVSGITSCDLINGENRKNNSSKTVSQPSEQEIELKQKKQIRENIANYVSLHIDKEAGEISVSNNTDYTLERVDVMIAWTEGLLEKKAFSEERSFTYIKANSTSTKIPYDKWRMDNIYGQISLVKCSSLGL